MLLFRNKKSLEDYAADEDSLQFLKQSCFGSVPPAALLHTEQYLFRTPKYKFFCFLSNYNAYSRFCIIGVLMGAFTPSPINYHNNYWNSLVVSSIGNGNSSLFIASFLHRIFKKSPPPLTNVFF